MARLDFLHGLVVLLTILLCVPADAAAPVPINTAGWAEQPFISRDGKRLYFTYWRWSLFSIAYDDKPKLTGPDRPGLAHVDDPLNALSEGTIYMAERKADGSWSEPKPQPFNLPGGINTGGMEAGQSFYFAHADSLGAPTQIYVSHKEPNGQWGKPEKLSDAINSGNIDGNPYVSPTEDGIWFSSSRPGSFGGKDLYFSQKIGGAWTRAVNLGPVVNSAIDEDQPWVNPDGSGTIYYNRGNSFMATQWKDGAFTTPQPFIIPGEDIVGRISFTDGGKEAFFASADPFGKRMRIMRMLRESDGSWSPPTPVD